MFCLVYWGSVCAIQTLVCTRRSWLTAELGLPCPEKIGPGSKNMDEVCEEVAKSHTAMPHSIGVPSLHS